MTINRILNEKKMLNLSSTVAFRFTVIYVVLMKFLRGFLLLTDLTHVCFLFLIFRETYKFVKKT